MPACWLPLSQSRLPRGQGNSLKTDLVAYLPLDTVAGTKTPGQKNNYDFTLDNLTAADLVRGKYGMCFALNSSKNTMIRRTHPAADDLPANKHASFTISFRAKVSYAGQTDKWLFGEGSSAGTNPLFAIGTGSSAAADLLSGKANQHVICL